MTRTKSVTNTQLAVATLVMLAASGAAYAALPLGNEIHIRGQRCGLQDFVPTATTSCDVAGTYPSARVTCQNASSTLIMASSTAVYANGRLICTSSQNLLQRGMAFCQNKCSSQKAPLNLQQLLPSTSTPSVPTGTVSLDLVSDVYNFDRNVFTNSESIVAHVRIMAQGEAVQVNDISLAVANGNILDNATSTAFENAIESIRIYSAPNLNNASLIGQVPFYYNREANLLKIGVGVLAGNSIRVQAGTAQELYIAIRFKPLANGPRIDSVTNHYQSGDGSTTWSLSLWKPANYQNGQQVTGSYDMRGLTSGRIINPQLGNVGTKTFALTPVGLNVNVPVMGNGSAPLPEDGKIFQFEVTAPTAEVRPPSSTIETVNLKVATYNVPDNAIEEYNLCIDAPLSLERCFPVAADLISERNGTRTWQLRNENLPEGTGFISFAQMGNFERGLMTNEPTIFKLYAEVQPENLMADSHILVHLDNTNDTGITYTINHPKTNRSTFTFRPHGLTALSVKQWGTTFQNGR